MSFVELRIELPTYAHSFLIQVPDSCTILDVKEEIYKTCPGRPRVDSQKLIWRGRYLVDSEKVEDIWKTSNDPRVIHLAVHPSGWGSKPPQIHVSPPAQESTPRMASASALPNMPFPDHHPLRRSQPQPPVPTPTPTSRPPHPLAFVATIHQTALLSLTDGIKPNVNSSVELRLIAKRVVERNGWAWPAVFDQEFPEATPGGLRYEKVTLDQQQYLSLRDRFQEPTPLQAHALKVLSYSFTILSMALHPAPETTSVPSQYVPIPPAVNDLIADAGMAQAHFAQNGDRNALIPQLRQMPLRPLIAPLMMLLFRTVLLLYFVAPARKPIFGIFIIGWMLYEIWQPIRNGLERGWNRVAADQQGQNNARPNQQEPNNEAPAPQAGPVPQPGPMGAGGLAATRLDTQLSQVFDYLGNLNMQQENEIINQAPGAETNEPGVGRKAMTFLGLLVSTIHPAIWNRRRAALRRREGVIRTEANIRNAQPRTDIEGDDTQNEERAAQLRADMQAQYARRPQWVQRYMERVIAEDWVDDSD